MESVLPVPALVMVTLSAVSTLRCSIAPTVARLKLRSVTGVPPVSVPLSPKRNSVILSAPEPTMARSKLTTVASVRVPPVKLKVP